MWQTQQRAEIQLTYLVLSFRDSLKLLKGLFIKDTHGVIRDAEAHGEQKRESGYKVL